MSNLRNWVETILYGGGAHRRFTQDSPVLLDVWSEYLSAYTTLDRDRRLNLLIKPFFEVSPADVVSHMRDRMGQKLFEVTQTTYNRTVVSSWLKFEDLVAYIIPLTRWYSDLTKPTEEASRALPSSKRRGAKQPSQLRLPTEAEMWEDVGRPMKPTYPYPRLLGFAR